MTACCILHNTYDPGNSLGSANQCILGDVYLRSNLSSKVLPHAIMYRTATVLLVKCTQQQTPWVQLAFTLCFGTLELVSLVCTKL